MKKILWPIITLFFFLVISYLLYQQLNQINFSEVKEGFLLMNSLHLFYAAILVILNYSILSSYDYIGLKNLKSSSLAYHESFVSAFVCYAFTLNLGALIGGLGLRYKIYTGWGISKSKIAEIILFSVFSNWSGYIFLSGLVFMTDYSEIASALMISSPPIILCGVIALSTILIYIVLCERKAKINFRKIHFRFPSVSVALLQIGLSSIQWLILGGIVHILIRGLGEEVEYLQVLRTILMTSIAGVVTHIPAGLGVIETIFLKVNQSVPSAKLLVALLCFRALYYLFPLLVAIPTYFSLELYLRKRKQNSVV